MGAIVFEPMPGRGRDRCRSLRARGPRARRRLELGHRRSPSTSSGSALASLFSAIVTTAEAGAREARPGGLPARARAARRRRRRGRCTSATSPRTRRAPRPRGCDSRRRRSPRRSRAGRERARPAAASRPGSCSSSALAALGYASRAPRAGSPTKDVAYQYSTAVGGARPVRDHPRRSSSRSRGRTGALLALRRPTWLVRRCRRRRRSSFVAVYAASASSTAYSDPGREQGLTPTTGTRTARPRSPSTSSSSSRVAPVVEELTFRGLGYSLLEPLGTVDRDPLASASPSGSRTASSRGCRS